MATKPRRQIRQVFSGPNGLRPCKRNVVTNYHEIGTGPLSPLVRSEVGYSFKDPPKHPCPKRCCRYVGEIGWWHTLPDCPFTAQRLKPFQLPPLKR